MFEKDVCLVICTLNEMFSPLCTLPVFNIDHEISPPFPEVELSPPKFTSPPFSTFPSHRYPIVHMLL